MKERRYKEDYRLVTSLDDRGRPRQTSVYVGDWFALPEGIKPRKSGAFCMALAVVFASAFGAYLWMNPPSTYCFYVLVPASVSVVPLAYWLIGAVNALRAPERMTRVQRETGIARVARSALACAVCVSAAVAGDIVFIASGGAFAAERCALPLLGCAATSAFCGLSAARRLLDRLRTIPADRKKEDSECAFTER